MSSSEPDKQVKFEVVNRFAEADHADHLLYAPLGRKAMVRRSRVYHFTYQGKEEALESFVRQVLVDSVAQEMMTHPSQPWSDHQFVLERSIKAGALDNERETILRYREQASHPGFTVTDLRLAERFYIFADETIPTAPFVRDLVNEAVQSYQLIESLA